MTEAACDILVLGRISSCRLPLIAWVVPKRTPAPYRRPVKLK
jgi:hypothetical protein